MSNTNRIDSVNGLKGIGACIIAFCWHYQHFNPSSLPLSSVIPICYSHGWIMVDVFFALSGFGIMMGYSNSILKHEISFWKFIFKRIKKLYPLFILTTVIVAILQAICIIKEGNTFIYSNYTVYHFLLNVFLIQSGILGREMSFNGPAWSLSVFLLCYVVFYFICINRKNEEEVYLAVCFLYIAAICTLATNCNYPMLNEMTGRGIASFSSGVILYGLYKKQHILRTDILGYISLVFIIIIYIMIRFYKRGDGHLAITLSLAICPAIIVINLFLPWIEKIMELKPLVFLGGISLEIYLFHFPVQCIYHIIKMRWNMNYASFSVWMSYIISVIVLSCVYKYLFKEKYERWICGVLLK